MKEKLDERRAMIKMLLDCNETFLNFGGINFDEYTKNHDLLISAIINDVILSDTQVNSIRMSKVTSDLRRFKALMTLFQMYN